MNQATPSNHHIRKKYGRRYYPCYMGGATVLYPGNKSGSDWGNDLENSRNECGYGFVYYRDANGDPYWDDGFDNCFGDSNEGSDGEGGGGGCEDSGEVGSGVGCDGCGVGGGGGGGGGGCCECGGGGGGGGCGGGSDGGGGRGGCADCGGGGGCGGGGVGGGGAGSAGGGSCGDSGGAACGACGGSSGSVGLSGFVEVNLLCFRRLDVEQLQLLFLL
ncbi:Hypothetical predicted protein [Mytilus galloprovincialis]|uniref:Uncharacterized protein n=1 Tax=Mytilus galloprovincialis TaxID=29158 RepID=A0A8B6DE24_MYTGA|nr:Hypothetical predicted protein [Mytilus galloprovincialis]